jgi:hypothetical protein
MLRTAFLRVALWTMVATLVVVDLMPVLAWAGERP